tara:strand:+ start:140817 stop:141764 length:948 start_codon:yes stop_codon:yes gene_type:complete
MKTIINICIIFILFTTVSFSQSTQKEVLIIGTMHTVPKIVKKSYKPMLRRAKKYNPQAIYVESPMANDSISWEYLKTGWSKGYQKFYQLSNSLKKSFDFNEVKFNSIIAKSHAEMTPKDLDYLINSFGYLRDNGNYGYYSYIKKHGIKGTKKATRHEDGDLTYKLALQIGIKMVANMDDQRTNGEYHTAWNKCSKEGGSNGNNAVSRKLNKRDYNSAMIPAIFRGLGKHVNKRKSLERLHNMSSFSYVIEDTEGCKEGRHYWRERNERMADNIATQILTSENERSVVIVGASHVIGLEKALKENYPTLKIKLMND